MAALAAMTGNVLPLIVGGAAEALYLINAPGSQWFERYLTLQRARRRGRRREAWRRRMIGALARSDRERYRMAERRLAMAESTIDQETRVLAQTELERVEDLLDQLLDLLVVRGTGFRYLASVETDALEAEIHQVERRLRDVRGDPDLAQVLTQRLDVIRRRLAEREEIARNLDIVTSQISTLEHSIAYLADKLVSWSAAGREPQGLREILAGVESTEEAVEQVRPAIDQIQRVRQA